jgi:succinate-semialdehyde dehydrogenase/glutarate-semialdehyde dehydrogenase
MKANQPFHPTTACTWNISLAAGCTCVIKVPEETPFSGLALMELAKQAGFPAGVVNVITSQNSPLVGQVICASKTIKKVSFTGSTPVGKILAEQCAGTLKK